MKGFIKLFRKFKNWEWYSDNNTKAVYLHLLLSVSYRSTRHRGIELAPGQLITSTDKLASELGLTAQQIRTSLKKLEKSGEINKQTTNKYTVITVEKWRDYQADCSTDNTSVTNKQQTNNKQITTFKKNKNINNIKNINNPPIVPPKRGQGGKRYASLSELKNLVSEFSSNFQNSYMEYVNMRSNELNKPLTLSAARIGLKQLSELACEDENKAIAIIEQSIKRGWQDFYELTERRNKSTSIDFTDLS